MFEHFCPIDLNAQLTVVQLTFLYSNQYNPYDNRLTRRVLPPQYRAEMRGPPPRQVRPAGPNVVAPTSGNWYYTVQ